MATKARMAKKNWLKAAVFTFIAVDCVGIYVAEKKLNDPVPDSLRETPLALAGPATPSFSPTANPARLEFAVPRAQQAAAPAPVQMARAEPKPVAPAIVAPTRAVPAANPLVAPRMVEARPAAVAPAARAPIAAPRVAVAGPKAVVAPKAVAAPKPARIEIPHPTFASAAPKAQAEHHLAHRAIERPVVPSVHVEHHAHRDNAFANAFANGIGSLTPVDTAPPVQVSIAPVQPDGLLPVAPPPAEPELPAVQLGVTSAPAVPADAAPVSQAPAQAPGGESANPRI